MARICPLFSGSTGNSTYIASKNGGILIDAGASMKSISCAIEAAGGNIDEIKAVAVTHTHSDHIKGLKPVLNKTKAELIATADTAEQLIKSDIIPKGIKITVIEENTADVCGMELRAFATSHDCAGSCGYTLVLPDGKRFSVCTDLGIVTDDVHKSISGSDVILLESNHDVDMLKRGPYPPSLKVRILSDSGHISNAACAQELKKLFEGGTKRFILGHLSQHNNTPLIALSCAEAAFIDMGAVNGKDYKLTVANPKNNGVTVI